MSSVSRVSGIALTGIDGHRIVVEAAVGRQLPGMNIVGLPDAALSEAKQRVRHAAASAGLALTDRFVLVNLQPADLPKHGSGFDLPIAISALAASGVIQGELPDDIALVGELGLDGVLRRPRGLLASVIAASRLGYRRVMVPAEAAAEAVLVPTIEVVATATLTGAVNWFQGREGEWHTFVHHDALGAGADTEDAPDMSEVVGQALAVRALTIAAAGGHHVHLTGPPGAGKTMLASRLRGILPDLTDEQAIEVSGIAALASTQTLDRLIRRPPFVHPHHTASQAALIGSGQAGVVSPGAITRAHHGLLFLDEAPEFSRSVLDALRQPLESGKIEIHRAGVQATLPAQVQLVLASNPCLCGKAETTRAAECLCTPQQQRRYAARLSGPLRDRIDLTIRVQRVDRVTRSGDAPQMPTSLQLRQQVTRARQSSSKRLEGTPWRLNADVPGAWLRHEDRHPPASVMRVLDRALSAGHITLRGYDRTLRVAWSIADLRGDAVLEGRDIAEALMLRGAQ